MKPQRQKKPEVLFGYIGSVELFDGNAGQGLFCEPRIARLVAKQLSLA